MLYVAFNPFFIVLYDGLAAFLNASIVYNILCTVDLIVESRIFWELALVLAIGVFNRLELIDPSALSITRW